MDSSTLSNPIPILAAQATSTVNQLEHSPPHPPEAFSPSSFPSSSPPPTTRTTNGFSSIPPLSPAITEDSPPLNDTMSANSSPRKVHPADLVSIENPDPHISPDSTPTYEPEEPAYSPAFSTTTDEGSDGHSSPILPTEISGSGRRDSEARVARSEEAGGGVLVSENGAHVGHGSEEDGGGESMAGNHHYQLTDGQEVGGSSRMPLSEESELETQEPPIPKSSRTSPSKRRSIDAQSVLLPITASTSMPQSSREPESSPRSPSKSSNSGGPSRQGDRRDREREKEQRDATSAKERERESTRSRRVLGEWTMSKTLGAGSMGKVKLGISGITGEKVAIKIIPRYTSTAAAYRPPPSNGSANENGRSSSPRKEKEIPKPSASFLAKAAAKDVSKEVRTMREASLSMLLHHPYVCGMKSMFLYPNHYYMVFEYVNGGQMLDYIISHGRLRERSARKFARQIGSALEYCHANSIVHRDLKIENILISKTGNIKIIDFGLSNLYSPMSHLNTFCGSLYFAAPELLNAKSYTGPEVDVWSFGIVLYVLVCGKVPFDDQSMPALHAKIKRGQVEYPNWLSAECKHLLSRMLVTVPSQRATLTEIFAHPWMMKGGFTGPPASHLPPRIPLRIEEIDREVIKGMVGFEFGSEVDIHGKLLDVLESELYINAVRAWDLKQGGSRVGAGGEAKIERPSTRIDGKDMKGVRGSSKRFSGLGFYGKKIAGGLNAAFAGASMFPKADDINEGTSSHHPGAVLPNGLHPDTLDPTRGFHPLISIYYLVREKIEREQIWGPGVFASSTLSLTGPLLPPAPAQAYQSGSGVVSTAEPAKPSAIHGPTPPQPPPSSLSTAPRVAMSPQPRQKATEGDYRSQQQPSTAPRIVVRENYLPSQSAPVTPNLATSTFENNPTNESTLTPKKNAHVRTVSGVERGEIISPDDVPLGSQSPGGFARRFGSFLGRNPPSPDGSSKGGHRHRASIAGTSPRTTNQKVAVSTLPQLKNSDVPILAPPEGQAVTRASTVGELSPGRHHHRGNSMGTTSTGPIPVGGRGNEAGARRNVSLGPNSAPSRPRTMMESEFDEREEVIGSEAGEEGGDSSNGGTGRTPQQLVPFIGRTAPPSSSEHAKPVWLKGLFSVQTTTTKSTATLKADLINVLTRLGVQFVAVKSGFECAHVPSIDLSSLGGSGGPRTSGSRKVKEKKSQSSLPGAQRTSSTSFTVITTPPSSDDANPSQNNNNEDQPQHPNPLSSDLIVRFEIFIVKIPLLGIHGLQFRRIGGNAWAYQMLAKTILQELKL